MKAEDCHIGNTAGAAALVFSAQGVAGIFDHDQPVAGREFFSSRRGLPDAPHNLRQEPLVCEE